MKRAALATIAVCTLAFGNFSPARADAIIENGHDYCSGPELIVHGVSELHIALEMSGVVDVSDRKVRVTCIRWGNTFESTDIICPEGTNRFYAHRQRQDNSEWLYECRVKS